VPSVAGPFGVVPAATSSGGQVFVQEPVQMNLPFFSTLRL
jgi:hypothetical protein